MRYFSILGGLLIAAWVIAPVTVVAEDHRGEVRYYDRDGRDYHNWNGDEDRTYRQYLTDNHRKYKDFKKQSASQQRTYWTWRHAHGG